MEKESFISGYCRVLDQSRMVTVVTEKEQLLEVDCCYENCIHAPNCQIAKSIRKLLEGEIQ